VGAILRNYQGEFIAASCKFLPNVPSAAMAEVFAMQEGLNLAERIGCNWVVTESDSTKIIQACSGEQRWWEESAAIFADCIDTVALIGKVSFNHVPREKK
jgi:hypothetical protein